MASATPRQWRRGRMICRQPQAMGPNDVNGVSYFFFFSFFFIPTYHYLSTTYIISLWVSLLWGFFGLFFYCFIFFITSIISFYSFVKTKIMCSTYLFTTSLSREGLFFGSFILFSFLYLISFLLYCEDLWRTKCIWCQKRRLVHATHSDGPYKKINSLHNK
jgi:hypothetical protein